MSSRISKNLDTTFRVITVYLASGLYQPVRALSLCSGLSGGPTTPTATPTPTLHCFLLSYFAHTTQFALVTWLTFKSQNLSLGAFLIPSKSPSCLSIVRVLGSQFQ